MIEIKKNGYDQAISAVCGVFPSLLSVPANIKDNAVEIRLSAGRPVIVRTLKENYTIPVTASPDDIERSMINICNRSVHCYEKEISEGFITIKGGHRIGFCGTGVYNDGKLDSFKYISSLNIRIASEKMGCADSIARLFDNKGDVSGLIIAGPPLCGKTTILRDLCRSIGSRYRLALIDERNEIGASYNGMPQLSVGMLTDVYSSVTKKDGMMRALRTMSPDYIVMDELGAEISDIAECANCGCGLIMTAHSGKNGLYANKRLCEAVKTGAFSHMVIMGDKIGSIKKIRELEHGDTFSYFCDEHGNGNAYRLFSDFTG